MKITESKKRLLLVLIITMVINLLLSIYINAQENGYGKSFHSACFMNASESGSCLTVQTSQYARTFGVPNTLYGMIFFSVLIVLISFLAFSDHSRRPPHLPNHEYVISFIGVGMVIGVLVSLWFLFVQFFILNSFCRYCLVIDILMILSAVYWFVISGELFD